MMDVDAVVAGILIAFMGVLLILERTGLISSAAFQAALPFVLLVVGALVIYVGVSKDRLRK